MSKNIVICADGTWNKHEDGSEKNTNVARIYDALQKNKPSEQLLFYDPGIGTGLSKLTAGATGLGISKNIRDCYAFLVDNYKDGDRVYLFGFSRGAYTVRSLAGFVYRCGILRKDYRDSINWAYRCYRNRDEDIQKTLRDKMAVHGNIYMIGVWDTVGALGIPVNWLNNLNPFLHKFHDTALNPKIKFAYHALAIDETRKNFLPTLWQDDPADGQTIEQVWFAGDHSDIGGGHRERGLSDITLAWMIAKAKHNGLVFKAGYEQTLTPDSHDYLHNPRERIKKWFYRKKLREIKPNKQSILYESVFDRILSKSNRPNPEYRPQNLSAIEDLASNYKVATKIVGNSYWNWNSVPKYQMLD